MQPRVLAGPAGQLTIDVAPLARRTTGIVTFLEDLPLPPLPIWLTMHADLQHNPRMRFVSDFLHQELRAYARS